MKIRWPFGRRTVRVTLRDDGRIQQTEVRNVKTGGDLHIAPTQKR